MRITATALFFLMAIGLKAATPIPTPTPTPTETIPAWLLALPTIPVSQQIQTTPEKTPAPAKIVPTNTPTPEVVE